MEQNARLALARLHKSPRELQIADAEKDQIATEIKRLIELDRPAIWEALKDGEASGLNRQAREIHRFKRERQVRR
jgi:hypothetical protein